MINWGHSDRTINGQITYMRRLYIMTNTNFICPTCTFPLCVNILHNDLKARFGAKNEVWLSLLRHT